MPLVRIWQLNHQKSLSQHIIRMKMQLCIMAIIRPMKAETSTTIKSVNV